MQVCIIILLQVLMSRDSSLQVISIQCVQQILSPDVTRYSDSLLDADIAEFLFEALSTTDVTLLRYIISVVWVVCSVMCRDGGRYSDLVWMEASATQALKPHS